MIGHYKTHTVFTFLELRLVHIITLTFFALRPGVNVNEYYVLC